MIRLQAGIRVALSAVCLTVCAGCEARDAPGQRPAAAVVGAPGSVVSVGLTTDLPGWGLLEPGTNTRSGFDYDLMGWLGNQMHFTPTPVDVTLEQRIPAIQNLSAPLMLANLSMTDERRKLVGFAGPYMITQQTVMVRKGDNRIQTVGDMANTTVCTASGTTSLQQLNDGALKNEITIVQHPGFRECVKDLKKKKVGAVSTDQLSLLAFAQEDPSLQVQDFVFGAQDRYGIGLPHGDIRSCENFTAQLRTFLTSGAWDTFFKKYFPNEPSAAYKPDPNQLTPCQ